MVLSARQAGVAGPTEGLGHTLRTPLTALNGALGLLGAGLGGELPADARALLEIALRNCAVLQNAVESHLAKQRSATELGTPSGSMASEKIR